MPTKKQKSHKDKTSSKRPSAKPTIEHLSALAPQPAHPAAAIQRATRDPRSLSSGDMQQLQRAIGNRAVGKLLSGGRSHAVIQPKLRVGPANDKYEQEADQIARQVVQQTGTREAVRSGMISTVQRLGGEGGFEAGHEIESRIAAQRGGGQPLPASVQTQVEPHLGADFSGVRVHTDAEADTLNQSLSAQAFTTGQDIFFRRGDYNPASATGQKLLAHELTHVVQQTQNGQTPPGSNAQPPAHIQTAPLPSDAVADQKAKEEEKKQKEAMEKQAAEAKRKAEEEAKRKAQQQQAVGGGRG